MAKVTNALSTYSANIKKEDVSSVINNVAPYATPILTKLKKRKVTQPTFFWQTDTLKTATTEKEEGFVAVLNASAQPASLSNVVSLISDNATVTGTTMSTDLYGRRDEMSYQLAKLAKHLKVQVEQKILSNAPRVDGNDSGTARVTEGLEHSIQTNRSAGASYAAPASQTAAGTDGTLRTFTESMLLDALETCYTNGGEPRLAVAGPRQKRKISGFQGRGQLVREAGKSVDTIYASASVYESDFGDITVVLSRNVRPRTVLVLDTEMAKLAMLRDWETTELGITGDARSKMLTFEFGVENSNELAHAKVADLDPNG